MPYKSHKTPIAVRTTKLAVAVTLIDTFTGRRPIGNPVVSLIDENEQRTELSTNASGDHLLLFDADQKAPTGAVKLQVTDKERKYLGEERSETISETPSLFEIELVPSPSYEFAGGATLLRGHVRNNADKDVEGATVTVRDLPGGFSRTNQNGEFAIPFEGVQANEALISGPTKKRLVTVSRENGKRVVKIDGNDPTIEAVHESFGNDSTTLSVEKGGTTKKNFKLE